MAIPNNNAKKFVLLSADAASRIGNMPNLHQIQKDSIGQRMSNILDNPDLPSDQKMVKYMQEFQRYLIQKKQLDEPLKFNIGSENEPDPVGGKSVPVIQAAVNTFQYNNNDRDVAGRLARELMNAEGFSWNDRGEIAVDGRTVPGSSLASLL